MPVRSEELRDRVLGCFLGLAVGDALGSPHRHQSHYQIEAKYPQGVQEMSGGGKGRLSPGEWTSSTAQALAAAESLLADKGFEGLDITMRLTKIAERHRDTLTFELTDILRRLDEDPEAWPKVARRAWYESGGTFAGNGCLTRAIPAALYRAGDLKDMIADTISIVHITHWDPRCVEAAIAVNFLAMQCVSGQFTNESLAVAGAFLDSLRREADFKAIVFDYEPGKFSQVSMDTPMRSYEEERDAVPLALKRIERMTSDDLNVTPNCAHTMACAVWALCKARNFAQGVSSVVSRGGESDKTGALAGALLGARHGLSGIPKHWLAALLDRPRLSTIAEQLFAGISKGV